VTDDSAPLDDAPRVSIVVPAYNRERYLAATLDSVLAQSLPSWELVVFDDGSTDGTVDVAERYAAADQRIRVQRGPNGGVASARNRGFAATDRRTEFVIFLDSDDRWEPDTLAGLVGALDAHPDRVSAYGLARCMDGEGRPIPGDDLEATMRERLEFRDGRLEPLAADRPLTFASLAYHNWVITPGIHLVRRAVAERVGEFDPTVDPGDDWDMAIRISRFGDIHFLEQVVLHWRRHGDTLTMGSPHWRRAYFGVRRKMFVDPSNTPEQIRLARAGYRHVAREALRAARAAVAHRRFTDAARDLARSAQAGVEYARAATASALAGRRARSA
jgi:glycosyltransferase involved in cell wall biosynthesis